MKTYVPKAKDIVRSWHLIDLQGQPLGRAASRMAVLLQGKHKPSYIGHLDAGDYVVAVNAREVIFTGRKPDQKMYFRHSGYAGGMRLTPLKDEFAKKPERVVEWAVRGMLPKNKLQTPRLRRLKVFAGKEHTYQDKFKKKEIMSRK